MSKLVAGQDVEIPGFVLSSEYGYVTWSQNEMLDHGYVTVAPHSLAFTVPDDFNSIASEVEMLNKKIDAMADEYHGKVAQIKERIANLLCIEHTPAEEVDPAEPEYDDPSYCAGCNGSGEGQFDGSTCSTCKGKGEL
jgi:hypothetical protein